MVKNLKAQPVFSESQTGLEYKEINYSLRVSKSPFQIIINNNKRDVIKINDVISEGDRRTDQSIRIVSWTNDGEKVQLLLSKPDIGFFIVIIRFQPEELNISVCPADKKAKNRIGFQFSAGASGHWYGGSVVNSHLWPLEVNKITVDPFLATSNQVSPVWYTSNGAGIAVRTYNTLGYSFNQPSNGMFELYSKDSNIFSLDISVGKNIREAYFILSGIVGKPFVTPPYEYFAFPQFNTWIEFMTKVNQEGIWNYAQQIRKNNFPARLFIIDDKWTRTYGDLEFDSLKFPDPGKMISDFHANNFKVALWITPFIERNAKNFRYAADKHFLIMDSLNKEPYFTEWWNGLAALVDLSNPDAYAWFLGLLKNLQNKYKVDGFKLDAGDAEFLNKPYTSFGKITPNEYADVYAGVGGNFEANELKVSWLAQSKGLIQRLRDKAPNWSEKDGINSLIPNALTASLLGYCYVCPDMIGGGLDEGFTGKDYKFDEELFVRWAEVSALMPMMQYSLAPWKLKQENISICRKYSELHVSLGNYIYKLAEQCRIDGTPIVRPVFFEFPEDTLAYAVKDQFMLGDRFLVAPVLHKGASSRKIYLPESTWIDFWTGRVINGPQSVDYATPLDVLPVFIKVE